MADKKRAGNKALLERYDASWSADSIRLFNTPTPTARQTFFYVQEAGYFRTSAPYFTERENLDSFLLIFTLSGKGRLKIRDREYLISSGDTALINCNEHHYYECVPGNEWEFLWVHFNGPTALGYYNIFAENGYRIICGMDSSFMELNLWRIISLTRDKDLHGEITISGIIAHLLTEILVKNNEDMLGLGTMPEYIKEALLIMEKEYADPLSLESLSDRVSMNKYYFAKQFKRYLGITPNEYLINLRVNHAKELLRYSQSSVEEISYSCGFNYTSHFVNTFRKKEGVTPLVFRRNWS